MDINVTLKIESPEIMASILALAESLAQMKLKVKHYWEEDNNKILGKTLDNYYEKDSCVVKREGNTIVDNEVEKSNKLEAINNANGMLHLSNRRTGISEKVTEHIEENTKETLKDNGMRQSVEVQSHAVIEHIKEISKKEAKEQLDKIYKEQGIENNDERKD